MVKVLVKVKMEDALLEGIEEWGDRWVDVDLADLTREQRAILAVVHSGDHNFDLARFRENRRFVSPSAAYLVDQPPITKADLEAVRLCLDWLGKCLASAEADKKRKEDQKKEAIESFLSCGVDSLLKWSDDQSKWFLPPLALGDVDDPRVDAKIDLCEEECKRRNDDLALRKEKEKQAGLQVLKDWVLQHGEEELALYAEEGFDWVEEAERAYAVHLLRERLPAGTVPEPDDGTDANIEECASPAVSEVKALRWVRGQLASLSAVTSVGLFFISYKVGDRITDECCEICVDVCVPTGTVIEVFYFADLHKLGVGDSEKAPKRIADI